MFGLAKMGTLLQKKKTKCVKFGGPNFVVALGQWFLWLQQRRRPCFQPLPIYTDTDTDIQMYLIILNFAPFGTFIALCGHCGAYFWVRVKFKNIFGPTTLGTLPNAPQSKVKSQKSKVKIQSQKSKVKNQKSKVKNQKSKVKSQKSKVKSQKSKVKSQK